MPRRIPAVALLLAAATPAQAAVVCVDDAATLQVQLAATAEDPADDEIRLRTGSYALAGLDLGHQGTRTGALRISGGWGAGCATQTLDPTTTVLDGGTNARLVLRPRAGDLEVSGLTFTRFAWSDPVAILFAADAGRRVRLSYSRFTANRGPVSLDGLAEFDVHDNLFARNLLSTGLGCNFRITADPPARSAPGRFVHNTYAYNERPFCLFNTSRHVVVANNVFWGSPAPGQLQFGVTNAQRPALFMANTYDQASGAPLLPESMGNSNADPLFADASNDDFRLNGNSTARDSGVPGIPGGLPLADLKLAQRPIGVRPDRGAYEETGSLIVRSVSTTADVGPGSLRQAILDANASGSPARISFALGGACGPSTITLASPLPSPTVPLTIDGYTQPGSMPNTADTGGFDAKICVVLKGSAGASQGFLVDAWADAPLRIRGLAFDGFAFAAINLRSGYGHAIEGNQFGGRLVANGATLAGSSIGVHVALDAKGVSIGGEPYTAGVLPAGARGRVNWFAGSATGGVAFSATDGRSYASGNVFGDRTNDLASQLGTVNGVRIVGSSYRAFGNVLNGLVGEGFVVTGTGAQHALIDGNAAGLLPVASRLPAGSAVHVTAGASDLAIGLPGRPNQLGSAGPANVWVESGQRVRIAGNRLQETLDPAKLNIDLGAIGQDANDAGDADTGANGAQNRPENIVLDVDVTGALFLDAEVGSAGPVDVEVVRTFACVAGFQASALETLALIPDVPLVAGRIVKLPLGELTDYPASIAVIITSAEGTSEISACATRPDKAALLSDGFEGAFDDG